MPASGPACDNTLLPASVISSGKLHNFNTIEAFKVHTVVLFKSLVPLRLWRCILNLFLAKICPHSPHRMNFQKADKNAVLSEEGLRVSGCLILFSRFLEF